MIIATFHTASRGVFPALEIARRFRAWSGARQTGSFPAISVPDPAETELKLGKKTWPQCLWHAALLGLVQAVVPDLGALLVAVDALEECAQRGVHVEVVAFRPVEELRLVHPKRARLFRRVRDRHDGFGVRRKV